MTAPTTATARLSGGPLDGTMATIPLAPGAMGLPALLAMGEEFPTTAGGKVVTVTHAYTLDAAPHAGTTDDPYLYLYTGKAAQ